MSHNKLLVLSSEGQSSASFNIDFMNPIDVTTLELALADHGMEPITKIVSYTLSMDSMYMPMFVSNIHTRFGNNNMTIHSNGNTYNLTIPNGLYNTDQLGDWITGELDDLGLYEEPNVSNGFEKTYPLEIYLVQATGRSVININDLYSDTELMIDPELSNMLGFTSTNSFQHGRNVSDVPSNMNTMRPINVYVDIVDGAWMNGIQSYIIGTFVPSRFYGEMMTITPLERKSLPMNVSTINRIGVRLVYSDNNQVVFDREDVPVILNLFIQRNTI